MRVKRSWVSAALAFLLAAGPVSASGFSIFEQSAKASGVAGAWVATADDAAANWYNPAALTKLEGMQIQFGINLIPVVQDSEFTATDPTYLLPYGISPPQTFDGESNPATPFHLYFTHKVNDLIAWGIGINTPYGLITEWSNIPVTLSAKKSELVTFVVNPNIAFGLGAEKKWSIAVGVDYIYADVQEFSRVIDFSAPLMQPPGTFFGESNLTGTGDDWGFNAALHYAGDKFSFGLTGRSELSPTIEGDLKFTGVPAPLQPLFPDTGGSAVLDLPAQAAVGIGWPGGNWNFEVDVAWAGWSSFERIAIMVDTMTPALGDITLEENWDDTFSYRFGAAWQWKPMHQWRFGAVYDEAPVRKETLRPSIPDADRIGISAGYGYSGKKWNLDAYLMPLVFDDALAQGDPLGKPLIPDGMGGLMPNPGEADGVIDGEYTTSTMLFGVTFNYKF